MAAVNEMRLPDFSVCLQAQVGIMPLKGKCIPRVQRVVLIIIANCPSPHTNPTNSALSLAMHYILASLVKGEVLSPEKIRATTGGIALHPHHQLDFPHYLPPHSPTQKIRHLSKQRILYIQFSALVKMVSDSKAIIL